MYETVYCDGYININIKISIKISEKNQSNEKSLILGESTSGSTCKKGYRDGRKKDAFGFSFFFLFQFYSFPTL